ncbi:MAG TPA: SDR family NAD(P)-dependent oxidoreductase [Mycobacteriales bacterium]|nr:SDR family NAD(P)-dependent oxidoreductase [Mycobacteriales bacterium]
MGSLDGRVALVTGASRGLGAAIARRFALEGAAVAALARTLDPDPRYEGSLRETVASIESAGGRAVAVQADLARSDDRIRAVAEAEHRLGPVDVLVNNAAVTYLAPVESFSEKRFRLMVEVQVWAPFHLTQLVLPGMYERGRGWILNISSRASEHAVGPPFDDVQKLGFSAYGMGKAALERFTTALAAEGHDKGVRASSLAPWDNVATPGAGAHALVEGFPLEDESVMAEAALALVEGDLTGRIAISQHLLAELGRHPRTPVSDSPVFDGSGNL